MLDFLNISHPILDYALRAIVCSGILWLICFATARFVSYRTARLMILCSVLVSLLLPLWRIGVFPAAQAIVVQPLIYEDAQITISNISGPIVEPSWFTLEHIALIIYGGVMLILIARMSVGLIGITRYRRNSLRTRANGITININPLIENPFSFGHTIYIGDMEPGAERDMVLTHESLHVKEHHTAEVLVMEILGIVMWVNPFFYLLKRLLREVHEYQADSAVVEQGNNIEKYKLLIFSQMTGQIPELAGALTHSLTKKRLIMITQKTVSNNRRALLLLPALALCAALVSFTTKEATPTQTTIQTQTLLENPTPDNTPIADTLTATITIRKHGEDSTTGESKTNRTIIIDGKKTTPNQLKELAKNSIKSVEVNKNNIIVSTTPTTGSASSTISIRKNDENATNIEGETNRTIIIDGKQATHNQLQELAQSSIKSVTVHNNSIMVITQDTIMKVSAKGKDEPVLSAEVMPTFMGEPGATAFSKWCVENMKYPTHAKKDLKSAHIVVSLVINKEGKMESPEVTIRSLEFRLEDTKAIIKEINESILEVLKSAPDKWTPGTVNGEPVSVKVLIPILLQNN